MFHTYLAANNWQCIYNIERGDMGGGSTLLRGCKISYCELIIISVFLRFKGELQNGAEEFARQNAHKQFYG